MKSLFEKIIGVKIPCDYGWDDDGIVRIGAKKDIAAYAAGDFKGKCIIFLHGNGETAISEKELYDALNEKGISVIAPDYRGYGLTAGEFSENGCYEAAHAAYEWLRVEKQMVPSNIIPLGYSLGSGVAVELAVAESVGGLILQAPYYSGRELLPYWVKRFGYDRACHLRPLSLLHKLWLNVKILSEQSFATKSRLDKVDCPALVFHGSVDTIIPYAHGTKVFDGIASRHKEFVRVEGGSHNNFQYVMGFETYVGKIVSFCMVTLKSGGLMANSRKSAAVDSKIVNPSIADVDFPKHDKMNSNVDIGQAALKRGYKEMLLPYLGAYGNNLERRDVLEGNFCLKLAPGFAKDAVVERRSQWNAGFRFDGKTDSEWVYVEHMIISPDHINDEIEQWVGTAMAILGKPILHSKSGKDNADFKVVRFGLVPAISSVFMEKHRADDMVTYVGTILRNGVTCRVFILCLRRGNESWMVEYVFPAYVTEPRIEGGKLIVYEMRPPNPGENVNEKISQGEMQIAGMVLGNFRALDGIHCAFCDKVVSEEAVFLVELDNVKVFDDLPLRGKATCKLPCCDECKQQVAGPRLVLDRIKETANIRSLIEKGATFDEDWIRKHTGNGAHVTTSSHARI